MRAVCFRHLHAFDHWASALESARRKNVPAERIEREVRLGRIQQGMLSPGDELQIGAMIEAGASVHEVVPAFVHGYLARERPEMAATLLGAWAADSPDDAFLLYMQGLHWRWLGEPPRAEAELRRALAGAPGHELARTTLAEMLEQQDRLAEALEQYAELATRLPDSEAANLGLVRLLRKTGRHQAARAVLRSLESRGVPSPGLLVEAGQIDFDLGNLRAAQRHFARAGLDRTADFDTLTAAAAALALDEKTTEAEQILTRLDAMLDRMTRMYDLRVRLTFRPNDQGSAEALRRLSSPPDPNSHPPSRANSARRDGTEVTELYAEHCAACHGVTGDGKGRAARYLFPKPRDLRTGNTRLASTDNAVPTAEDIESVIQRGMPGTSMRSFEDLGQRERSLLAEEVLRMQADGMREQLLAAWKSQGETVEDDELEDAIAICTTPGDAVALPPIGRADPRSIQRRKDVYFKLGCDNCHGDDGTGCFDTPLFDEKGNLAPPRDLVHEPFKGGLAPESIYLRLSLGMPGTPHPAAGNLDEASLVDLVHYCLAISKEPKRIRTEYERAQVARRAYRALLNETSAIDGDDPP